MQMGGDGRSYVRLPARPRLLLITPDFPPAHGGIQLLAHRVVSGLQGFDTRVVTLDSPGAREFDRDAGLATRRVGVHRAAGAARQLALNAAAVHEALAFRPQATLSAHIVASPAADLISRALGACTVQYFHAKEIPRRRRLAAFAARRADACIAVSSYTADLVAATGARGADVRLIPPGVDLPSDPAPPPAERPTFLTVARLEDRYKGHDVLLAALPVVRARVPDVEWIVIGDGPLRPELEARARAEGVADAVRFLGALADRERDDWLRRADLLAMPSRLPGGGLAGEGFGIVYLEAAAHGKPVVAGNVGGAVDAVADGESGLLVDPTDPAAVAEAIATLLLDRELARRLGSAGAQRARRFAWPVIAGRVEALLLEQLGEARPRLETDAELDAGAGRCSGASA
ncbi:MAG TPA: glycosyltransferase family 4 protein [Solirubrobacteraceae bacterium]|nr:glycosyltransferase family 4 protein [Solirubrobacteraceae bacterium]